MELRREGRQWLNTGLTIKAVPVWCFLWGLLLSRECCNSLQPAGNSQTERAKAGGNSRFHVTHELTQGFQNITCYLPSVGQLPVTSQFFYSSLPRPCPQCGAVMGLMLITVPPASCQLRGVLGTRGCKPVHAFDDWVMHPSRLYLCIQAALCCSHSQWQEMESLPSHHNK